MYSTCRQLLKFCRVLNCCSTIKFVICLLQILTEPTLIENGGLCQNAIVTTAVVATIKLGVRHHKKNSDKIQSLVHCLKGGLCLLWFSS